MTALPGCEEVNTELATSVLEEGGKFCAEILEPLNRSGGEEGCKLEDGLVTTPKGFADAYKAFAEAGWPGLSGDPEYGGQGLPRVLQILFDEMLSSSNLSFGLFSGLTRGAVEAIADHGNEQLKQKYLPKMISGEWTGAIMTSAINLNSGTARARSLTARSRLLRHLSVNVFDSRNIQGDCVGI
uniref:acyl-CoA dehydrogenase family protein n=1 Tax=Ensifer sesbaniae TaxID=1214071 RepID=UPI0028A25A36|nr:acyl-CoA dehydrogenase family protein [Ensifer sesbaniae]